jgi:hypothetical protein
MNFEALSNISSFGLKMQGMKAKPKENGEAVAATMETIASLKERVLPFGKLGMKFRTIDVFWSNLSLTTRSVEVHPSTTEEDATLKESALRTARPPDGMVMPIWRLCHMGILLQAYKDDDKEAGLTVAIHLNNDGIRMEYDFGTAPQTKVVSIYVPEKMVPFFQQV